MKKLIIIMFLSLLSGVVLPQGLQDFKYLGDKYGSEGYWGVSGSLATLSNSAAPRASLHHVSGTLAEIEYDNIGFTRGELNYSCDYKLLTDLIFLTGKMINRKNNGLRNEGSGIGGGIIGWHSFGWNMIAKPKFCLAPGFALNDYFFGVSYWDSNTGELVTPEPQGWYISSGPALFTHHYLNSWFLLHLHSSYVFAFSRPTSITYAEKNDAYPKPHFFHLNATLMTRWGIFTEMQYSRIVNGGNIPNKTQRIDLKLGFSFVL